MEKWVVTAKRADFAGIGAKYGIDPVIARIIRNRDVVEDSDIDMYLNGGRQYLHDPHLLKDVDKAVNILENKIRNGKSIRVIGDYDIDGVNATYILLKGLKRCGANVDAAIPDRMKDGYGLNINLVDNAKNDDIDTIITCDNGIAAIDEIAHGKELGMTIIVTDHHEVPYRQLEDGRKEILRSNADAIVNPKQEECEYPFSSICGAVVAWKLVQVLYEKMGIPLAEADEFLENAAFATVGDVMELKNENRVIVKLGLDRIHNTGQQGLRALILKNSISMSEVKAYHFGFILGPCINASGRLDTARRSLNLLMSEDMVTAEKLAQELIDMNASRKELTVQGVRKAMDMIEEKGYDKDKVMVVYMPECHESLAGIIAGRIREHYNKPVFVLTKAEEGVKGSGRSIEAYSMFDEMVKVRDVFTKFGGHPMAAGLSLEEERVDEFRRRINEVSTLTEEDFIPKIAIDVPMPLEYVNMGLIEQLSVLEPFGKGNEKPIFADKDVDIISAKIIGKNQNVLKMRVRLRNYTELDALYFGDIDAILNHIEEKFGKAELEALMSGDENSVKLSIIYYPDINEYQGRRSIQIMVQRYL